MNSKKQAKAPQTHPFGKEAFGFLDHTTVRWLGNGGLFINSRGTCLMVDPVLEDFSLPLLVDVPIPVPAVPFLDGILITHSDDDHFSLSTCKDLLPVCRSYHTTRYVAGLMEENRLPGRGYAIGEQFSLGPLAITLTPADHAWQNDGRFGRFDRTFLPEDCCGFWIDTPDGAIWAPGDTRLLPAHLEMEKPEMILFDFSDDPWHMGAENAVRLANRYPNARLLLSHWGTMDAPEAKPFNADPAVLEGKIVNPGRVLLLAPGEGVCLSRAL